MGQERWIYTIDEGTTFVGLGYQPFFTPAGVELIWILFEDRDGQRVELAPAACTALIAEIEKLTDFTVGLIDRAIFRVQYTGRSRRSLAILVQHIDVAVRSLIREGTDITIRPVSITDIEAAMVHYSDGPQMYLGAERHWAHH